LLLLFILILNFKGYAVATGSTKDARKIGTITYDAARPKRVPSEPTSEGDSTEAQFPTADNVSEAKPGKIITCTTFGQRCKDSVPVPLFPVGDCGIWFRDSQAQVASVPHIREENVL
jgi:hypothetical protein